MRHLITLMALVFSLNASADIGQNTLTLQSLNLDNAGTAQQVTSASGELWVTSVTFQAPPGNSGNVFIANSAANAQGTSRITLQAGESLVVEGRLLPTGYRAGVKLQDIYWDGATAGDDLVYIYVQ